LLRNLKWVQFCFLTYCLYAIQLENTKLKRKKLEWGNTKRPQRVTEQEICTLYTGLESNQNSSTFTRLLRGNVCNPITYDSEVGSSNRTIRVQEVESQCRNLDPAEAANNKDFCCELKDGLKIAYCSYCYPIQGQMATASRKWYDLVIYSNDKVSVERISFDENQ